MFTRWLLTLPVCQLVLGSQGTVSFYCPYLDTRTQTPSHCTQTHISLWNTFTHPISLITAIGVCDSWDAEGSMTVAHLSFSPSASRIKIFPQSESLSPNSTHATVLNPQPHPCFSWSEAWSQTSAFASTLRATVPDLTAVWLNVCLLHSSCY